MDFQLSREKFRKTEAVFLVGSRESEGNSKSPPNREFSSRFGKEEMSTEDKRRRLRRLVPPWSFLTRQRFLLEKQKKMLYRTCKFAAVHRPLCSFPETPEASPMRGSCRRRRLMRWAASRRQGASTSSVTAPPCHLPLAGGRLWYTTCRSGPALRGPLRGRSRRGGRSRRSCSRLCRAGGAGAGLRPGGGW